MLNQNPVWKTLLVLIVVFGCALYALPNIYGEDFAVQISADRDAQVDQQTVEQVSQSLEQANIDVKRIEFANERILVRVFDNDTQLAARDNLQNALGDNYIVAMNLAPDTPEWLASIGGAPMKLGLDLRGGVHFLMEVDMNSVLEKAIEDAQGDFRTALREEGLRYRTVRASDNTIEIVFRDQETLDSAEFFLKNRNRDFTFEERSDLRLVAIFSELRLAEIKDYAVNQNITIIRNRVNQLGVAEPLVQKQGADRIVVQLPGIQDTAKAKEILNATATLEFRMVDQRNDIRDAINGRVPPSSELIEDRQGVPQLLEKRAMLKGSHIIDANSGVDEYGVPQVNISLDSEGGSMMSRGTKGNIGKPMATVFIEFKPTDKVNSEGKTIFVEEREVINVATIQAQLGSSFRITGLDSPAEARDLALLLRAGALFV